MNENITRSGYTHCACRDCMDVTVSSDTSKPELCELCSEAGCVNGPALYGGSSGHGKFECQRDDAYEGC